MKFTSDESGHLLEIGTRTTVYFSNDWKQLFQIKRLNWYSFTLAHFEFEIDEMSKHRELVCILFGLGFTLRYDHDFVHSEIHQIAEEAYERIQDNQRAFTMQPKEEN